MSTTALVSAVIRRLRKLSDIITFDNDVCREMVVDICSGLEKVTAQVLDGAGQNFSQQVLRLAYDLENAVEGQQESREMSSIKARFDVLKTQQPGRMPEDTISWATPTTHELIGLEDKVEDLFHGVIQQQFRRCVIVGMAGTGKSALASTVLCNQKIMHQYFRGGVFWVSVTRKFGEAGHDVMLDVFESSGGDVYHIGTMRPEAFERFVASVAECNNTNKNSKTSVDDIYSSFRVIIFDDVWSLEIYDSLRCRSFTGAIIIITTRDERVAATIMQDFNPHNYTKIIKLGPLSDNETMQLFQRESRQTLPDIHKNEMLKSTVKNILNICQGIPMQTILVARSFTERPLQEWDVMLNEMLTRHMEDKSSFLEVMGLSYQSLETWVKPCFLYLGLFPPDQPIAAEKLCLMFMAERLASTRDEAESYLERLTEMNLLIAKREEESIRGEFISCQFQEMVHRLSLLKGKSEELFAVVDLKHGSEISSTVADRVSIYLNGHQGSDDDISSHIHERIRTLLLFGDDSRWPGNSAELENLQWTRVLEFDAIDFRDCKFPMSIDKLVYLRYLSIAGCYLEEFPLSCSDFPYMETLDLRVRIKMIIPNVLWNMPNLRHLFFPEEFQSKNGEKLKLEELRKLETVENFHADLCDMGDLLQFEHLQIFKVVARGENEGLKNLISNMDVSSRSRMLKKSCLNLKEFDCYSRERRETLKDMLECHGIHNLYLDGFIKRMPKGLNPAQNVTEMVFDRTAFSEDPMPILGRFVKLESLVLRNHAITVEEISCRGSCFVNLKRFEMTNLPSLKKWVLVETGHRLETDERTAMSDLKFLIIKQCHNLLAVPEELGDIYTLSKLIFGSMSQEFKKSVQKVKENRVKIMENKDKIVLNLCNKMEKLQVSIGNLNKKILNKDEMMENSDEMKQIWESREKMIENGNKMMDDMEDIDNLEPLEVEILGSQPPCMSLRDGESVSTLAISQKLFQQSNPLSFY